MENNKRRKRSRSNQGNGRLIGLAVIPVVIIVAVILFIVFDRGDREITADPVATSSEAVSLTVETDEVEPDNNQYEIDFSKFELHNDNEELTALVQKYCQAHMESNPDLLEEVYNITMREDEKNEIRTRLELEKKFLEGYENITCYYVEGPEPDSFVIFPYFEMNFKEAELFAPSLTALFVMKNEEGNYYMTDRYMEDERLVDYMNQVCVMEDVILLKKQVDDKLQEAIRQDEALKIIYDTLLSRPESTDTEVIISETQSSEAPEESAGSDDGSEEVTSASQPEETETES